MRPRLPASRVLVVLAALATCGAAAQEIPALLPPPADGRELLALYGIDDSQLARLQDGEPLGAGDEETLVRILYYFPRFRTAWLEQWARSAPVDWRQLAADPPAHRAAVVRLAGRVQRVERVPLLPEVARRTQLGHYYRVALRLPDARQDMEVAARAVPSAWVLDAPLDEPVSAIGLFLKTGRAAAGTVPLVFAVHRFAWHPDVADPERGLSPDLVFLAQQGVDVELLLAERAQNRKGFTVEDRDSFYQLLSTLKRDGAVEFAARASPLLPLGALLQQPERHHGDIVVVEGQARAVTRVRVDEPDIQQLFGLDHYYQIDLFVPLDNQVVRLAAPGSDAKVPTFENSYPVTVCVPSLPPELESPDALPAGVRMTAIFFKLWAYRSEYVASFNENQLQLSPMLLGSRPQVVRAEPLNTRLGAGLAAIFAIALLALWIGMNRYGADRNPIRRRWLRGR